MRIYPLLESQETKPIKPKRQPQAGGSKHKALNPKHRCRLAECDCAKQSQFRKAKKNVTVFLTKDYEDEATLRGRENKPNQSQFVFFTAENAEFAEEKVQDLFNCKETQSLTSQRSLRSPRLMRNKANFDRFARSNVASCV